MHPKKLFAIYQERVISLIGYIMRSPRRELEMGRKARAPWAEHQLDGQIWLSKGAVGGIHHAVDTIHDRTLWRKVTCGRNPQQCGNDGEEKL